MSTHLPPGLRRPTALTTALNFICEYAVAQGYDMKFALELAFPFFGRGPYSGTIWLENEPPRA